MDEPGGYYKMDKAIDIPNIEAELQKLWKSQSLGNQLKASLFNLVIYTHESRRKEYVKGVIRNFIVKFPCRIIFIDHVKDNNSEFLHVNVADRLQAADGTSVACDQIYIEVTSSYLHRVPYIILPHFIPDLPIYLLWGQDPIYEHVVLPSLEQYAVRLIYDSECNHNLKIFSTKILERMHRSKLEFMDVSWGLIGGWRDAIATCFDDESKIASLKEAERIEITYNAVQLDKIFHTERQAIYFQTWIASQMEWKFINDSKEDQLIRITYHNRDHEIEVVLIPERKSDLPPGQIISVEINSPKLHTKIKIQDNNPSRLVVDISTDLECELPFILTITDPRRGSGVLKELFFQRPSLHYKQVLTYLSHIDLDL